MNGWWIATGAACAAVAVAAAVMLAVRYADHRRAKRKAATITPAAQLRLEAIIRASRSTAAKASAELQALRDAQVDWWFDRFDGFEEWFAHDENFVAWVGLANDLMAKRQADDERTNRWGRLR